MPDTGVMQYLLCKVGAGSDASIGMVEGGDMDWDPNIQNRRGTGGQNQKQGGPMALRGTARVLVQDETVFKTAGTLKRSAYTSPSLTSLQFEGGTSATKWRHTGCNTDSITFEASVSEALRATWSWIGTGEAAGSGAMPAESSDLTFEWFQGTLTGSALSLLTQSMSITLSNNLEPRWSLDTKANHKRLAPTLIIHNETVTLETEVLTWPGSIDAWVLADDVPRTISATYVFVGGAAGADSISFALSNLTLMSYSHPIELGDGTVSYRLGFEGRENNATTLVIS